MPTPVVVLRGGAGQGGVGLGRRPPGLVDPGECRGVSGVFDEKAVLEEVQPVARFTNENTHPSTRGGVTVKAITLLPGHVLAVFVRSRRLVVARCTNGMVDVDAHRGPVDLTRKHSLGQLGEPLGIDLHEHLGPRVRRAVGVGVLVQGGVDDEATSATVVVVVVVDEDGLADKGLVALLDLIGGELVIIVITTRRDCARANVDVSITWFVIEHSTRCATTQGRRLSRLARLGRNDRHRSELAKHYLSPS